MKKKILFGVFGIITIFIFSLFLVQQPKPAKAAWCGWGYKSTTVWPGQCISCFCDTWNYTGRDACPKDKPE